MGYRKNHFAFALALACAALSALAVADPLTRGSDPETGLRYWEWHSRGVLFKLTQRLPDQTRAFFLARDFEAEHADIIATHCVFQTMFMNDGDKNSGPVEIDLNEWVVESGGAQSAVLTRERWKETWAGHDISPAALIAFEWSLLPTRQSYQPDDYNWGMTSYGLAPGTRFDLTFSWRRNGQLHKGVVRGVECPPDIHPEPGQSK